MTAINNDTKARALAIDPSRSVLVQAPAGSGKTTLLVRRFLRLLAHADAPEQVLAITFTKKAAQSMRERILRFIRMDSPPAEAHDVETWEDAMAIRSRIEEWEVLRNPSRLKIMTIDSFCARLVKQMPVLSGLGKMPALSTHPQSLYREAARRALAAATDDADLHADVQTLLQWRDNDLQAVESLLSALIPKREQWIRALGVTERPDRAALEECLSEMVSETMGECADIVRAALTDAGTSVEEIALLAAYAGSQVKDDSAPVKACVGLNDAPAATLDWLDAWRGIGSIMLTGSGTLRARVTVRDGFPAKLPETERMKEILAAVAGNDALAEALGVMSSLPRPEYDDESWAALQAVVGVLQRCAIELELVFSEAGRVDFAGVAAAALRGLGDPDNPTDLALYLDNRIHHILMDECQDANRLQMQLLERLTDGWLPGDGRTLFLVGDPMQSIYRFRQAQVGLFIKARDEGVGPVRLDFAQLTRNFRSRLEIVDWVNSHVGPSFPGDDDQALGQVKYADSVAARAAGGQVLLELGVNRDRATEAEALADYIEKALSEQGPEFEVAVLVRSRSHLDHILPVFRRRQIPFSSLQLDRLIERPAIQDLHALTRALWHLSDRASWLALLRAPWCGLTLADTFSVAQAADLDCLMKALLDPGSIRGLSDDGRERVARVADIMESSRGLVGRAPFRDVVEGAWTNLGGPEVYADPDALRDVYRYLALLESFVEGGRLVDWGAFETALDDLRSESSHEKTQVSVMTIHESKGLEFDMVVLPALDRHPRGVEPQLVEWLSLPTEDRESLLVAPMRSSWSSKADDLTGFIRRLDGKMESAERKRLLYVATTRAKNILVVSASASLKGEKLHYHPASMLSDLWGTLAGRFVADDAPDAPAVFDSLRDLDQRLHRVPDGWQPSRHSAIDWTPDVTHYDADSAMEYDWGSNLARKAGRAMHRVLEAIGRRGIDRVSDDELESIRSRIPLLLQREGVCAKADLTRLSNRIRQALDATLADTDGRWVLSSHEEAACELPLSGFLDGQLVQVVIDRTFIVDGERWIVDWKSGGHLSGNLDAFLANEAERHKAQLHRYGRLFEALEGRRPRLALYLPACAAFVEVDGKGRGASAAA
jgi:ATP-dependent helicase/nuclease subunit A